jgi:hypothetical protein
LEGGPPCFPQTHRGSWYSGSQPGTAVCPYRTLTSSGGAFQRLRVDTPAPFSAGPTTPAYRKIDRFGLCPVRSPLLRASRLISLRRATEMFQFAHCPPRCLYIQQPVSRHHSGRVAPFGFSGLIARMQLPLNVSPVSASFIGLQRRGILRVLVKLVRCGAALRFGIVRASSAVLFFLALGKIEVIMLFDF